MKYEKDFFALAMAAGIANAEARMKKEGKDSRERVDLMQKVTNDLIAEWGLMEDFIAFATETTGIDATPYFQDNLKRNAKEKVELTKEVLFETAFHKGMMMTTLQHTKEFKERNGYDKVNMYCETMMEAFELFFEAVGIADEYSKFLRGKLAEIMKKVF